MAHSNTRPVDLDHAFSLRLRRELWEWLAEQAAHNERTVSAEIRWLIESERRRGEERTEADRVPTAA